MLEAEPLLRAEGLQGGFRYFDCVVNDARLTLTTVRSAVERGRARPQLRRGDGLQRDGERVQRRLLPRHAERQAGDGNAQASSSTPPAPGSDRVREMAGVAAASCARRRAFTSSFRARASRLTTHRRHLRAATASSSLCPAATASTSAPPTPTTRTTRARSTVDAVDAAYVLEAPTPSSPARSSRPSDVVAGWAGVRPLVAKEGTPLPSDVSRDFEIDAGPEGFYSIAGGKLTTSRAMAEALLDNVIAQRGPALRLEPEALPDGGDAALRRQHRRLRALRSRRPRAPLVGRLGTVRWSRRSGWCAPTARSTCGSSASPAATRAPASRLPKAAPSCAWKRSTPPSRRWRSRCRTSWSAARSSCCSTPSNGLDAAEEAADLMGDVLGWSARERQRQVERLPRSRRRHDRLREGRSSRRRRPE